MSDDVGRWRVKRLLKEKDLPSCNRASFWRLPVMHVESWRDDVKWVCVVSDQQPRFVFNTESSPLIALCKASEFDVERLLNK